MTRGFSFIEVLVAISIIGLVGALSSTLINSALLSRSTSYQNMALTNELEKLRNDGYAALPTTGSFTDSLMSTLPSGSGTATVSTYDAKTKEVAVSVSWQDSSGAVQSVALTTLMTETGGLP